MGQPWCAAWPSRWVTGVRAAFSRLCILVDLAATAPDRCQDSLDLLPLVSCMFWECIQCVSSCRLRQALQLLLHITQAPGLGNGPGLSRHDCWLLN